jgi:hypothetical protein
MNTNNNESYCDLTILPGSAFRNKGFLFRLNAMGIKVDKPADDEIIASAHFPSGWTIKQEGRYFTHYFNPNGKAQFFAYWKNLPDDKYAYLKFIDEE